MQLLIAEKPSVARDLARVLGVRPSGKTHYEGDDTVITWCVGHLVELDEPAAYDPRWKSWRLDTLPMLPERFKLRPATSAPEQWRAVRGLLRDRRFTRVVNACDAGREGELIFRYVYDLAGARLPIQRLWVSSLTDEAVRKGLSALRPGSAYEPLADAARCRSEADWLVGLNATRALTARARRGERGTLYSIGRVQTPTLAMLVAREREIRAFVPRDYWEVAATFHTPRGETFRARFTRGRRGRLATAALAEQLVARAGAHGAAADPHGPRVERVARKTVREPAPLLFDLTSLQRTANRRYGLSAARTLEVAQSLYEKHKVLTYPRTDSRHLSSDVAKELPRMFEALAPLAPYQKFAQHLLDQPPRVTRRVADDGKVQDHHAIVPTGRPVKLEALDGDERRIFDLVARRFLGVFYPDAEFANTELTVRVGPGTGHGADEKSEAEPDQPWDALGPPPDRFVARGRVRLVAGWQEVAGIDGGEEREGSASGRDRSGDEEVVQALPDVSEGDALDGSFASEAKKTRPPARYTEATLLAAMEGAGRAMEDEELRAAMRDCGLGTPATRAAVIETLLKRGYVAREKKQVVPTEMGMELIAALPVETLRSAELTGRWEARLSRIARGEESREAFMADIRTYVREVIDAVRAAPPPAGGPAATTAGSGGASVGTCPRCGGSVVQLARGYVCAVGAKPCGLAVPRVIARRAVSPALAGVLLGRGRTQTLRGFKSKAGKSFQAALVLDAQEGRVRFDFGNGTEGGEEHADGDRTAARRRDTPRGGIAARVAVKPVVPGASEETAPRCPRCAAGTLVTGKRGWGCSRWREGCGFVVWFECAGKRVTAAQLRELLTKGRTRLGTWAPDGGPAVKGRLVLDANADGGAVRFEPG